ncbi:MAG: hypothetical protein VB060_01390 [Oscillibacter sp.]|nr:hypothetical protein [Oscillibacter sp.]MEA4992474.1 hypothetical protein [Oscillibacter sp.]
MNLKKLIGTLLVFTLILSMAVPAFAATDADGTVPVDGYIGWDSTTTDPSAVIDITYSVGTVEWAATNATWNTGTNVYDVLAGSYTIRNNSTANVDLTVTLKSFTLTSAASTLPAAGTLTLNTTGALSEGSIGANIGYGAYTNTTPFTAKLTHGTTWTYSFGGSYNAALPATALQPVYNMVLNFAL